MVKYLPCIITEETVWIGAFYSGGVWTWISERCVFGSYTVFHNQASHTASVLNLKQGTWRGRIVETLNPFICEY